MTQPRRRAIALLLSAAGVSHVLAAQSPGYPLPKGTNVLIGRIIDIGTERPVAGASVTLSGNFDASGKPAQTLPRDASSATNAGKNVYTTSEGYFVFRDLPAGRYVIALRAFGYQNNDYPPNVVEVAESAQPTSTALYVWKYGAIGGQVIDERGEPLVGMPVSALRRQVVGGKLILLPQGEPALTDDRGIYRIALLPPGSYAVGVLQTVTSLPANLAAELDARAANPQAAFNLTSILIRGGILVRIGEGQRVGDSVLQRTGSPLPLSPTGEPLGYAHSYHPGTGNPEDAAVITLGSGESRNNVDVPVRFSSTVTVSGVLVGPDGPMPNVAVRLLSNAGDPSSFDRPGATHAITDAGGVFTLLGVTPGEHELSAAYSYGDEPNVTESASFWARTTVSVGDRPIAGLILTMRPGVTISGRAIFEGSTDPVPPHQGRIPVSLQPLGATSWRSFPATIRPDGTLVSVGDPPGRYIVNAFSPVGWFIQTMTLDGRELVDDIIELGDRNVTGLVLTYAPIATRISGTVSATTGTTDSGTDVFVFSADGATWRQGIFTSRRVRRVKATSANFYEVSGMAPGDYYVAAVNTKFTVNWQTPEFLEQLTAGATRITLAASEQKTLSLRAITPRER